ncbi:MAG: hypothetical protein PHE56_05710 [Bacteroidales bacterium]|nr:hypothetical protein [Bacteroidales bacterium]
MKAKSFYTLMIITILFSQEVLSQRITNIDFKAPNSKSGVLGSINGYRPDIIYIAQITGDGFKSDNQGIILKANINKSNSGRLFLQLGNPFNGAKIVTIDVIGEVYNGNIRLEVETSTSGNTYSKSYKGKYFFKINTKDLTGNHYLHGSTYNISIRPTVPLHLIGAFRVFSDEMHIRIQKIVIYWSE